MKLLTAYILMIPLITLSQQTEVDRVDIFLDCYINCDRDYLQREMSQVGFYSDAKSVNLHIIVTGQPNSAGGEKLNCRFIGLKEFEGIENTLSINVPPNSSKNVKRESLLKILNKGIYAYYIQTKDEDKVSIEYYKTEREEIIEKDMWNNWVFKASFGGYLEGEEDYYSSNYDSRFTANRITKNYKFLSSIGVYSNTSEFDYEDFYLKTNNISSYTNLTLVKSNTDKFSSGLKANFFKSTEYNYDAQSRLSPCIEYNFFPYSESSEHRFSVLYGITFGYNYYIEETVYRKIEESYMAQLIEINYENSQTWGSFSFKASGNQILEVDTLNKYSVQMTSNIEWSVAKGLSLRFWGHLNFDRSQINLPLLGATYEETILRQQELESGFTYYTNFGLSYTFGSLKNNVVNPRF